MKCTYGSRLFLVEYDVNKTGVRTKSEGDVSHTASLLFAGTYRAYVYPRNRILISKNI